MKIEDSFIALSGAFIFLYFLGLRTLRTLSVKIHIYDTYYVMGISFISLILLLVAASNVVAYKIVRFSWREVSPLLSAAQVACTIFFFAFVLFLTISGTFIRTFGLFASIVGNFAVSQMLLVWICVSSPKLS